jgi:hypothetical protein
MASGLAVAQRLAIQCPGCARHQRRAPTRGRMPGAAPDRRAWKQVSATARDLRALPDRNAVSQLRPDLHGRADAMPRRAPASAKSSLVRAPPKSIPPRNAGALGGWLRQRSGVQTQFWSVRFIGDSLVTSSLQNVADYIPAMCSSGGSSALVVQSIDRNGYAPVSNFEGQASGPTAYVQIPAPPSPSLANSRKPQAATKFEGIAHRFLISAYSSFAPARFTTSAHFADSCLMRAANSSGVPPAGSSPICS